MTTTDTKVNTAVFAEMLLRKHSDISFCDTMLTAGDVIIAHETLPCGTATGRQVNFEVKSYHYTFLHTHWSERLH
jgi:hypothetical protein